jgi:hypothetical protein
VPFPQANQIYVYLGLTPGARTEGYRTIKNDNRLNLDTRSQLGNFTSSR